MAAVVALAWEEARRTWRRLLVITLVVAVGALAVMVTVASARRADSSYGRFRDAVADGDVFVGVEGAPDRLDELRDLEEVELLAPLGYVPIYPRGAPDEARDEGGGFASLDGHWLYDVQRPRVLSGRMPPADAASRVAVNEELARRFDVGPGSVLEMDAVSFETGEASPVALEVAAVVRTPMDIGVNVGGPIAYLPPGVLRAHPEIQALPGYGVVTLVHGESDLPAFEAATTALYEGEPSFRSSTLAEEARTVERAIDVQVVALLAVAVVAGLAAAALVIQLTARHVRDGLAAREVLRSIGASRVQLLGATALPLIAAASVAVLAAMPAAWLLSWRLPRGLARIAEPEPGVRGDPTVLAATSVAAVLLVTTIALLLAGRGGSWARRSPSVRAPSAGARAATILQRPGGSVPILTGLRLAAPPAGGRERGIGIAAYAGLVIGLAGVLASSAISAELDRVAGDSSAWGAPFDLLVGGRSVETGEDNAEAVAGVPGVEVVTAAAYTEAVDVGGSEASAVGVDAVEGELLLTMVEGRPPGAPGEVVVGPRVARDIDVSVGDRLALPTAEGGTTEHRVVGLGLVPIIGDNSYDNALVLPVGDLDALGPEEVFHELFVGVADGVQVAAVEKALRDKGLVVSGASPPGEQLNLRSALSYPRAVGVMVGVLALAAMASALIAGVNGRRLELAVLRAIGFTTGQVRSATRWQALSVGVVGLGLGVPVGWLTGKIAWQAFVGTLSLETSFTPPWRGVAALCLGALVAAGILASLIGRRPAQRSVASDLRAG